ncbi:MAG: DUF167 domain-containing protein [Desulfohalobiaceae bacterium]|nr:DUF167 domain-containing protein [Desulfohalobiaceae bacterium]
MSRPDYVTQVEDGQFRLSLWVQPGAKKSGFCGLHQGRLKLKVQAPPSEGRANKEVVDFLARYLGIKRSRVRLESGQKTRKKSILLTVENEPDWADMAR